jgi:uncharacterized lipoprotein YajG
MRRLVILTALATISFLTGCAIQTSGVVYGPPCGNSAYEGGHCPYVGYRKPVTLG